MSYRLNQLQIVFAVWAGRDVTAELIKEFCQWYQNNLNATSYTGDFGLLDKTGSIFPPGSIYPTGARLTVVYRFYFLSSGVPNWTDIMFQAIAPGQHFNIESAYSYGTPDPPSPPARNFLVVEAFWGDLDRTLQAQQQLANNPLNSDGSCSIHVTPGDAGLDNDPDPGEVKQTWIVYGRYISGDWYYGGVCGMQPNWSYDLVIPAPVVLPADRRWNILSATWGSSDITGFLRECSTYDVAVYVPTASSNIYNWSGSFPTLSDPNPGIQKMLVITYNTDASAYPVFQMMTDPRNRGAGSMMYTWPAFNDITAYDFFGQQETHGGSWNLLENEMRPMISNTSTKRVVIAAAYGGQNVVSGVAQQIGDQTGDVQIKVSPQDLILGYDPWPGVYKSITLVIGYPRSDPAYMDVRTIVDLQRANSWTITIPANPSPL